MGRFVLILLLWKFSPGPGLRPLPPPPFSGGSGLPALSGYYSALFKALKALYDHIEVAEKFLRSQPVEEDISASGVLIRRDVGAG
jgi:hypothetical protein